MAFVKKQTNKVQSGKGYGLSPKNGRTDATGSSTSSTIPSHDDILDPITSASYHEAHDGGVASPTRVSATQQTSVAAIHNTFGPTSTVFTSPPSPPSRLSPSSTPFALPTTATTPAPAPWDLLPTIATNATVAQSPSSSAFDLMFSYWWGDLLTFHIFGASSNYQYK